MMHFGTLTEKSWQDYNSPEQPVGLRRRRKLISCPTSFPPQPPVCAGTARHGTVLQHNWTCIVSSLRGDGGPPTPVESEETRVQKETRVVFLWRSAIIQEQSGMSGHRLGYKKCVWSRWVRGGTLARAAGQLGTPVTSWPAVAAGNAAGQKCANLTFSFSLRGVFVCPDVGSGLDVRQRLRSLNCHLLHMACTPSLTCESRHHAECCMS